MESGGKALLKQLHLGTPLLHGLRGLGRLGLSILCDKKRKGERLFVSTRQSPGEGKKMMRVAEKKCESWRSRREYSRARFVLHELGRRRLSTGTHP